MILADGVGSVPSDDRVHFPLDQDYVRERGSALSADVQVASFASADARAPPLVAEPASAFSHAPFADAQASLSASFARPRVCFVDLPAVVHPLLGQRRRITMGLWWFLTPWSWIKL